MAQDPAQPLLASRLDAYRSVVVLGHSPALKANVSIPELAQKLEKSLAYWRRKGHKGVWLRVRECESELVPAAVRLGFRFHHVLKDGVMLCKWLPDSTPDNLPSGPSHFVGVAGFVYRASDDAVLVVRERSGPAARARVWKLPGGLADKGEPMQNAAIREVREETGLECRFVALAAVQHLVPRRGNVSRGEAADMFCTCVLAANNPKQTIVIQESEISEAKWVSAGALLSRGLYGLKGTVFRRAFKSALTIARSAANRNEDSAKGLEQYNLPYGFAKGKGLILCPPSKL